jgi:uncharacterized membrane protein YidH (DUF202 family)
MCVRLQSAPPPFWFKYHRIIQSVGLAVSIAAFVVAIVMVQRKSSDRHFKETHQILGLVVMVVGIAQPLNALIRPHPNPRTVARRVRFYPTCLVLTMELLLHT